MCFLQHNPKPDKHEPGGKSIIQSITDCQWLHPRRRQQLLPLDFGLNICIVIISLIFISLTTGFGGVLVVFK